jgi:hypothetical protein
MLQGTATHWTQRNEVYPVRGQDMLRMVAQREHGRRAQANSIIIAMDGPVATTLVNFVCQHCRLPLKIDQSLLDLNVAAYEDLIGALPAFPGPRGAFPAGLGCSNALPVVPQFRSRTRPRRTRSPRR